MAIFQNATQNKNEKSNVKKLVEEVYKNKKLLLNINSKAVFNELLGILRPGRTTTLLLESQEEIQNLKSTYNGTKDGPHTFIKLKVSSLDSKKYPELNLLWKKDYDTAIEIIVLMTSTSVYYEIMKNLLEKIELAAFCKGGDRRARWKLDPIHPEYAKEANCYGVAAKLVYFILDILEADLSNKKISQYTNQIKKCKNLCMEEFNELEIKFVSKTLPKCVCPLCLSEINLVDFFRNGRNDPNSIVFGHYEFRGARTGEAHIGKNAFWIHRDCNSIQGIYKIEEIVSYLQEILNKHQQLKINWDSRG